MKKHPSLNTVAATLAANKPLDDIRSAIDMLKENNVIEDAQRIVDRHARLPTDVLKKKGFNASAAAAERAADAGGSPREQIDAARAAAPGTRLNYLPHQGAKERAKRLAKMKPQP